MVQKVEVSEERSARVFAHWMVAIGLHGGRKLL